MLKSFRNFTKSRYGLIVVFLFLGLIALAFAAGDITGVRGNSGGSTGGEIARVGKTSITSAEVRERIDRFLRNAQREGQTVTMEQFLAQGGLELAIDELVNSTSAVEFAHANGMTVSKRLIDGEIASNPAFMGVDGKFSQTTFEQLLSQNRLSPLQYRAGLTEEKYGSWLVNRGMLGSVTAPDGVLLPYASLLLERRRGVVGLVPTVAMDPGPNPDDKALTEFYDKNRNRYLVPETRSARYAMIRPDEVRAQAAATDAEIAEAFKKDAAKYAATEKRAIDLVMVLDQATAAKIAQGAASGSLDAAARAAGLEARKIAASDKANVAKEVSAEFANAAFAAPAGALTGPARIGTSWYVYRVTSAEKIPAKSLDQVRGEIAKEVTDRKAAQALADLRQSIEDGIADGKTFDEAVRDAKLTAQATPALNAQGVNPANPEARPDTATALIARTAFGFEAVGDEPQIVQLAPDGTAALIAVEKINAAAPRPLAEIRDSVSKDYLLEIALRKARDAANAMIAKLEKGMSMAQALAEAGVKSGPAPKPFDLKRSETGDKENFIQMAFSMAPKKAKIVEGAGRAGYYVVYLDQVEEQSAANDPVAKAQAKAGITPQIGPEYARQFVNALRAAVPVKRNEAAINALRNDLARTGVR